MGEPVDQARATGGAPRDSEGQPQGSDRAPDFGFRVESRGFPRAMVRVQAQGNSPGRVHPHHEQARGRLPVPRGAQGGGRAAQAGLRALLDGTPRVPRARRSLRRRRGDARGVEPHRRFQQEKNELAGRDWILIRGKLYEFDDFLAKWDQKVRSSENKDAVAVMLLEQIEEYKKLFPRSNFAAARDGRGSHWAQLFSMLRFPTKGPEAVTRREPDPSALSGQGGPAH